MKNLKDYTWEELLEATSGTEAQKEAGRASALHTMENRTGIHTDDEELRKMWASWGGDESIDKLQEWQKENDWLTTLHNLPRTDEWKKNIGDGNRGKVRSEELKEHLSKILKEKVANMTSEERSQKFGNQSFLGKTHNQETREKLREMKHQLVKELGDDYISQERRNKMREENGTRVAVYYYTSEGQGELYGVYLSQRHAQDELIKDTGNSFQISHNLKGRSKRFGATKNFNGFTAKYISQEEYEKLV